MEKFENLFEMDMFVSMTGEHLKKLRHDKGMKRPQFAAWLGGTTASTLNKWERGISPVPLWVERRVLTEENLSLPVELLRELVHDADVRGISVMDALISNLKAGIAARKQFTQKPADDARL